MEEQLRHVDFSTIPVDHNVRELHGDDPVTRRGAIHTLAHLADCGNAQAMEALTGFLRSRSAPLCIEDVRDMARVVECLTRVRGRERLVPFLLDQLEHTPSNNTTRQWIWAILDFLRSVPASRFRAPLKRMLEEGRFSTRMRSRVLALLHQRGNDFR